MVLGCLCLNGSEGLTWNGLEASMADTRPWRIGWHPLSRGEAPWHNRSRIMYAPKYVDHVYDVETRPTARRLHLSIHSSSPCPADPPSASGQARLSERHPLPGCAVRERQGIPARQAAAAAPSARQIPGHGGVGRGSGGNGASSVSRFRSRGLVAAVGTIGRSLSIILCT